MKSLSHFTSLVSLALAGARARFSRSASLAPPPVFDWPSFKLGDYEQPAVKRTKMYTTSGAIRRRNRTRVSSPASHHYAGYKKREKRRRERARQAVTA